MGFHQLGCTREEIVAEYAPELSPWLRKYLPSSSQPGDDLTDAELAARYHRNLATLHAPLLAGPEGGDERVQLFERMRKKAELCVIGALRLCHAIDLERDKHRIVVLHSEQALEAHRNGHVAIFPDFATGHHIAIPVESAWIMLEAVHNAIPNQWMYACNGPYFGSYETGGIAYEVSTLPNSTLQQVEYIQCTNTMRIGTPGEQAWLDSVDPTVLTDPQPATG